MASGFQIVLLLCLASVLLTEVSSEEKKPCCPVCPPGWTQFGDRCFIFHNNKKAWHGAEQHCLSIGGNLVSFHSAEENDFVRDFMFTVTNRHRITWIGGHDAVKEGFWMWSDGSTFDYTLWAANEPNNLRGEPCLEMNFRGTYWNDRKCTAVLPYMCSRDLPCCDRNH